MRPSFRPLCAAALLLTAPAAFADDAPDLLTDSFQVMLGTYGISSKPSVKFNGDTEQGTPVKFDEQIGGGDAYRFRIDGSWRFGDSDKHKVKFIAFGAKRSGDNVIDQDIVWDDITYPVNAKVNFESKFSVLEVAYEYEFLHTDSYEVGASIGVHYTQLEFSLKAKASESNGTLTADISQRANVDAPLPVVGLQGLWKLPHNFWLGASGQYFQANIDQYSGNLQDYRAMVTWQPNRWAGVGVGYDWFKVSVDVSGSGSNLNGSLDWEIKGPMIFYSVSF